MPTVKISQLATILTADVTGDDLIQIIDVGAATAASPGGVNKKITTLGLANGLAAIQTTIPEAIQAALDSKQEVTAVSAPIFNIAAPVDVASTGNNSAHLTTGLFAGATIDGVVLVTGNRVLLKNQNIASQNGIWIVNGSAAAATRATDFDSVTDISNGYVLVKNGTTNAGTSWVCNPITVVGDSNIVFKQFSLYNATSRITLGLENVNNTSDLDKPVSTLTQTALSGKQTTITGAASTVLTVNLSPNTVLISNADGKIASSAVTSAKLSYLGAVTSDVQAQLDLKAPAANPNFTGTVALPAGTTVAGSPIAVIPAGAVMAFAMPAAPTGWLPCDGAAVARVGTYATLFAAINTLYGSGDGPTTFNLPDLRGYFVRGAGVSLGATSGLFGKKQGTSNAAHTHTITDSGHTHAASQAAHNHAIYDPGHAHNVQDSDNGGTAGSFGFNGRPQSATSGADPVTTTSKTDIQLAAATPAITIGGAASGIVIASSGDTESRPHNIAMLYCIKY